MSIGFVNLAMLAGLGAVLIPPVVHLLNRRRYDVVDWGAMQFLNVSRTTRRRLLLEELLLMALRMGLIALLVLALAAPYAVGPWLGNFGDRPARDVLLILDASSSMIMTDGDKKTPFDVAREEAEAYLQSLVPGDRAALLLARQPPEVVAEIGHDLAFVRDKIADLPSPRGNPDWPHTLEIARQMLKDHGRHPRREIVLFTDLQRYGWADPRTLSQWERLAPQWSLPEDGSLGPRVTVVDTARDAARGLPNYSLLPLKTTRSLAWMGQRLKITGGLRVEGMKGFVAPPRLYALVDGKPGGDIPLPLGGSPGAGQVPFSFSHRFTAPGTHLVSVIVEPDLARDKRPVQYSVRDGLAADNRQDLAVEVVRALPVLLVDGDSRLSPESSTFFLERALAGLSDSKQAAAVLPRAVPAVDFTPEMLEEIRDRPKPRVVVLADVPTLSQSQADALERFVAQGGGVLAVLGPRLAKNPSGYNEQLYRAGQGLLPARLDKVEGDAAKPEFAAAPDVQRFQHPTLELFQEDANGSLGQARFPRWWKVTTPSRATVAALLTSADPLLVEHAYKNGRAMVCTAPLDRSWGTNFPSLWEYPVFIHELVYYLADARSGNWNLQPGQPLRVPAQAFSGEDGDDLPDRLLLTPPHGKTASLSVAAWPFTFDQTGMVGPYRLQTNKGASAYFVVHGDPRESDLTPCSDEDREKVARLLPVHYGLDRLLESDPKAAVDSRHDLWWIFLLGIIVLLCAEAWLTRRIVLGRNV